MEVAGLMSQLSAVFVLLLDYVDGKDQGYVLLFWIENAYATIFFERGGF